MSEQSPIYVTQPSLAPLDEYNELLSDIWKSGILTHNGPMVQVFEKQFAEQFGVRALTAVSNGTIALQMALKALGIQSGEVITTAFTWVATVSAIKWEGCKPVFVDIDPDTLNMDPNLIEQAITPDTKAIMPVHVFGNPCDVEAIESIASEHGLDVIYDAAHAVGSTHNGQSLLSYGDISATSFHATKLLNTAEGGGCVASEESVQERLDRIRFFGHDDDKEVVEDGFNGKMTDVHAALGISNLKYINDVISDRKEKYGLYKDLLEDIPSLKFQQISYKECNCSYFPVIFESEESLLEVSAHLASHQIYPRRYFYPSVNTFQHIVDYKEAPISEDISSRILCLPLYKNLTHDSIERISRLVNEVVD